MTSRQIGIAILLTIILGLTGVAYAVNQKGPQVNVVVTPTPTPTPEPAPTTLPLTVQGIVQAISNQPVNFMNARLLQLEVGSGIVNVYIIPETQIFARDGEQTTLTSINPGDQVQVVGNASEGGVVATTITLLTSPTPVTPTIPPTPLSPTPPVTGG